MVAAEFLRMQGEYFTQERERERKRERENGRQREKGIPVLKTLTCLIHTQFTHNAMRILEAL